MTGINDYYSKKVIKDLTHQIISLEDRIKLLENNLTNLTKLVQNNQPPRIPLG